MRSRIIKIMAPVLLAGCGQLDDHNQAASLKDTGVLAGSCKATDKGSIIDNMEDGDFLIDRSDNKLGIWYTFNPGGSCKQTPLIDKNNKFKMQEPGEAPSRKAAATKGESCKANGWAGGGIGFRFLSSADTLKDSSMDCKDGFDAGVFKGIAFAIRTKGNVRLQVCTTDVKDFNCHGFDFTSQDNNWHTVTVPFLQLLQEDWGPSTKVVPFDPRKIASVQFKSVEEKFEFSIDNVRFIGNETGQQQTFGGKWHAPTPSGMIKDQLKTEYQNWKARHLVVCPEGYADVRKENHEAVSEGTGYGMLMAVSLGDKETFERLARGAARRKNSHGLMSWKFQVCGSVWDQGAATDGDLDIAMAFIIADKKWGGFRSQAEAIISALKQYGTASCHGLTVLKPGDGWGSCVDSVDQRLNPSYFSPAYYRIFASYLPNQADFWNRLTRDTYTLLGSLQSSMGGLLPDWSHDRTPSAAYEWEACRIPFRIALDFAWHNSREAKEILGKMYEHVVNRGGPSRASSQKNSCFVGGFALSALAQGQAATDKFYSEWMKSIPSSQDSNVGDNPYYQGSLRVLYLLVEAAMLRI